ncbi:hypothetical protein Clacol_006975 [Clathrus columnatus]|uniref:Uncharacterized protein n=1 Tax=Clathrus columnatus TaxID=1419009 RepID=A0AAV5AIH8_9AGAM|nr:hypothetical protein Clacol_006975 [Clathrus columnatus]
MSDPFSREILQRSKSAKLDVIIQDEYSPQFASALQNLLIGESHRIRMLRLPVSHSELDQSLVQLILSSKFPALLGLVSLSLSSSFFSMLPVLASSGCLETLEYTLNDNIPLDQLKPIFHRLKNLSLRLSFSTGSALALVQFLGNIATLRNLRLDTDSIPSGLEIGQTNLPELQFLSISHSSLLEYFQTPKLSTLDVYWKYPPVATSNYSILEEFNFSSIRYLYILAAKNLPSKTIVFWDQRFLYMTNSRFLKTSNYCPFSPEEIETTLPRHNIDIFSDKFPRGYFRLKFENKSVFDTALGPILSSILPQLTNIKELYFSPYNIFHSSRYEWDHAYLKLEEIFAQIPFVQNIVITHHDTFLSFIRVFRNPSLLPQLRVLFYTSGIDSNDADYMEKVGKELTECLQSRQFLHIGWSSSLYGAVVL